MQTTDEHDGSSVGKAEDAQTVEEREEQFRTLAENIPGVATYLDRLIADDPSHSIPLYISPQVEQMLGYPLSEWLDESELWLRILHPEDRDRLVAADESARKNLQALSEEYRLLHRDGHVVWVSEKSAVVPDVSTGTLYWQGVMVDITKRKRAEEAMAASELKFRTLFDAAAIGVFTLALDGRITEANATIEWLGRYAEGDLSGLPLADLVDPDAEEILDELAELRAGHRDRCRAEHRFRRKDGSFLWCRTVVTLVRGPDLLPLYAMGMLEDFSARKLVEDELLHRAVHDALTRYVVMPSPESIDAVVLWIAVTHAQPAWAHAPRLVIRGPERRCGKSRLLDVVPGRSGVVLSQWGRVPHPAGLVSARPEHRCPGEFLLSMPRAAPARRPSGRRRTRSARPRGGPAERPAG